MANEKIPQDQCPQCVAVQAARKVQKDGGEIVGNVLLVGDYAL
jgi:hypothetical protein